MSSEVKEQHHPQTMDKKIQSIDDFPCTSSSSSGTTSTSGTSIWNERIEYPALRVPVHATARVRQQLKSMLWRHTTRGGGRPNIYPDPQQPSEFRILILQKQQQQQQANNDGEKEAENNQERILQQVFEQNKDIDIQKTTFTIDFTYDDYNVEQALRRILPRELQAEIPCSFESVGPIAHINLRPPYEPFKFWIGKILLDKNQPRIQTVVTKIGTIGNNEYRTFGMQIIAQRGRPKTSPNNDTPNNNNNNNNISNNKNDDDNNNNDWSIVTVKEEKCTFTLDFQKVYWNSRLAGEHRRMVHEIQKDAIAKRQQRRRKVACSSQSTTAEQQQQQQQDADTAVVIVADLMAGVGPFAIPLTAPATSQKKKNTGKKKNKSPNNKHMAESHENHQHQPNNNDIIVRVYANDLNPDSYKYLKINAKQNKCHRDNLICSNQDARALLAQLQKDKVVIDHVLMNLPASAPEFLDMFRGYNSNTNTSPAAAVLETQEQKQPAQSSSSSSSSSCLLPRIHVYCFAPKPPPVASQIQEQTKKGDDKSKSSSHDDATDFNQTTHSKSGAASNSTTANNNDDDWHAYHESLKRCANALGIDSLDRERDNVHIHVVRDVSPQKNMICISFQLPFQVTTLPSVPFQRPTTEAIDDDNDSGINGVPTDHQPLRKGFVDADDDDKRKRSLDPNAKTTTCTESKAEIYPNKRSKGAPIH